MKRKRHNITDPYVDIMCDGTIRTFTDSAAWVSAGSDGVLAAMAPANAPVNPRYAGKMSWRTDARERDLDGTLVRLLFASYGIVQSPPAKSTETADCASTGARPRRARAARSKRGRGGDV